MIFKTLIRSLAVSGFLLGAALVQPAFAGPLADLCVAAGGGAIDAKTCGCIETKSASSAADQKVLTQSFELSAKMLKGGSVPTDAASSDIMAKGAAAQAKYLQQCM